MGITFDQYQRYKTIQIIVKEIKEHYKLDKLNVLELGSNEQLNLGKFLPDENITYSDLSIPKNIDGEHVNFIKADATKLENINDNEYDITISSDVFEHIPKNKRKEFFEETNRVSKIANINCFPFYSIEVASAERRTNEYYKSIYGEDHIWLKEHIENGLPNINNLDWILKNLNKEYFMFEHGDIITWEQMTKATFYSYYKAELILYKDEIDNIYKENIFINDIGENNYRKFIVGTSDANLNELLNNKIKNLFGKNISQKYIDFLYKNIEDMRSIMELSIKKYKNKYEGISSVYLDYGDGFNEKDSIKNSYTTVNSSGYIDIFQEISDTIKVFRFDPIENKQAVLKNLNVISNIGKLDYEIVEGFNVDNYTIFKSKDPQIIVNCLNNKIKWIKIEAGIVLFDYNTSTDILNKIESVNDYRARLEKNNEIIEKKQKIIEDNQCIITKQENIIAESNIIIEENKKQIEIIECELENYKTHYNSAIVQRNELKRKLAILENQFNQLCNSTCWKITKPIRVILDFIKKILKSNKHTHLFCKGLKSLKKNGGKYTLKKVKAKVKRANGYKEYRINNVLTEDEKIKQMNTKFNKKIKFSIIVPLYNTPKKFLCEMINSCIDQTYDNWELCMADGSDKNHSYIKEIVIDYIKNDKRIKYKALENNGGISVNTNECIKMSTGEYISLFDHDDVLHPSALYEYMNVICKQDADFIYCDEDKFENDINKRFDPYFKPDYAIDNLRANNYICHFTVFKKSLLDEVGLFRKEFDGSQDHDIILRLTEKAKNIVHVPKILYHWRVSSNSVASDPYAKPYTIQAGINAVNEHLKRCNLKAKVESSIVHPNIYRIKYDIINTPLISILIPNKDHVVDLSRCINSILEKSTYKNIEIIIIENNSTEKETFDYYKKLEKHENIIVINYESNGKFNYSAINNFGVNYAKGDHLLFLNNDVEVINENWLEEMLMYSQREDVGAVGAKLYYPNNTIQHAGVIIGIGGVAGHSHKHFDRNSNGYFGRCILQQNLSAVTAACLMIKNSIFNEINGFDETFEVAFNDVDLCMRIRKAEYLIVWTPYSELYHYESISRGYEDTPEKQKRFSGEIKRFQDRWKKELQEGDPYYNANLTLNREDFSLK